MRLLSIESISCKSMILAERNRYLTFDESDLGVRTELKYTDGYTSNCATTKKYKGLGCCQGYSTWLVLSVRCDIGSTLESGP